MANKLSNLAVITGKYTNKQGEEKNSYTTIGTLIEKEDGSKSIKIDTLPINKDWNGWISIFEPRPKEDKNDLPF